MIGREQEQKLLETAYVSKRAEFVAVYGRRRVGKTFLIRHVFSRCFFFQHTGIANVGRKEQLAGFLGALRKAGAEVPERFANWYEAFDALEQFAAKSRKRGKKVIFLDELPWMDSPKSGFVSALEHFWNGWASARNDVLLVVCGSATSWIIGNIVENHGGLHNRITRRIRLEPFTLRECEAFCKEKGLRLSREQILDAFLVFGGVPYYWESLLPGESPARAVDRLFFAPEAELRNEFTRMFASLFRQPGPHASIVRALGSKRIGLLRGELLKQAKLADNGAVTKALAELAECGFVRKYVQPGKKSHNAVWQLVDNFAFFHLRHVEGSEGADPDYWTKTSNSPARLAWCGLAFELVCLLHVPQIKKALGISGVLTREYAWRAGPDADSGRNGAQVDLVIARADRTTDLVEAKYSRKPFAIDKAYAAILRNKADTYLETTGTRDSVHLVLVASGGMQRNLYSDTVQASISIDDLFA
jgi:hypothetical protein